jgi:C4-dicarboxylate-specific signal transduction histidine kinase
MKKDESKRLDLEEELTFFGTVTASISHDLNNAIAIIEQTAGLLEDLILDCEGDQAVNKEQLQRIVDRIGRQTQRGAAIVHRLNAFAHSVDEPEREIDLGDLTETVTALAHRMADRRRARLEFQQRDAVLRIRNNPFRVQQALYLSLKEALSLAPEGAGLVLSTGSRDTRAWIEVVSETVGDSAAPELSDIQRLMARLGGSLESTLQDGKLTIRLNFTLEASHQ